MAGSSLPRQSGIDWRQLISGLIGLIPVDLPRLPFTARPVFHVMTRGNLFVEQYRDGILQPEEIPYRHSLGTSSVLQDDNAHPHRVGFIRDYLWNLGVHVMAYLQFWPGPHWTLVGFAWMCCSCQTDQWNHAGWVETNTGTVSNHLQVSHFIE